MPPVIVLVLTPAVVSLTTGASQQFQASATWSDGSTTLPAVTWTATGGTVSGSGLYTAGGTAGTYRVVVASGSVADTSSVTVTTTATTTPAPDFVNAPTTGWTTIASLTWTQPMPYRRDPIYDPDNGSHLVDWGDDDPYKEGVDEVEREEWDAETEDDKKKHRDMRADIDRRDPTGMFGSDTAMTTALSARPTSARPVSTLAIESPDPLEFCISTSRPRAR